MLYLHEIAKLYPPDDKNDDQYFKEIEYSLRNVKKSSVEMIFEIGSNENSLKMWRGFFNLYTRIVGLVNNMESMVYNEQNIISFIGNRTSVDGLYDIVKMVGTNLSFIYDNGNNLEEQILSFSILHNCLKPGGVYIMKNVSNISVFINFFGDNNIKLLEGYDILKYKDSLFFTKKPPPLIIPIVIIAWNSLYFIQNFINQIKKFPNPIIILDNNSSYRLLLQYYTIIKEELGEKITIHLLDKNYGYLVYEEKKNLLPEIFILSDPDLELHPDMPIDFAEQLLNLSYKYQKRKVGSAIKLLEPEEYENELIYNKSIENVYYSKPIEDSYYELYKAAIDTTFCLINNNFLQPDFDDSIRVGGIFTVKHLPWYKNYMKSHIPKDEIKVWLQNNKSSTILRNLKSEDLGLN